MGLIRTALIFGAGYAVGDPNTRRRLMGKADELAKRPEVQGLRERGREVGARVSARATSGGTQGTDTTGATGQGGTAGRHSRWRTLPVRRSTTATGGAGAAAVRDPSTAPDGGSTEFLESRNPVEKVSPGTTADAPATDAGLISTDPAPSEGRPAT